MEEDFTELYVFNLRGNQRTSGEQSHKEGGKVFGASSRSTIAIAIGVKNPSESDFKLFYRDVGDYLTAQEKLTIVGNSRLEAIEWSPLLSDENHDWINQRIGWDKEAIVLSDDATDGPSFFSASGPGISTNRDNWAYNYSREHVVENVELSIRFYNSTLGGEYVPNPAKLKWSDGLAKYHRRGERIDFVTSRVRRGAYRPFTTQWLYADEKYLDRAKLISWVAPTANHPVVGFSTTGVSAGASFSVLATADVPNLHHMNSGRFYPRFRWESVEAQDGGLFGEGAASVSKCSDEASKYGQIGEVVDGYVRVDNVTDKIKKLYRDALGEDIIGDDIFHFVYGKLHDPAYRTKYAADLKKVLPHIETPGTREEFDKFAAAGEQLMELHVNYEDLEPWPLDVQVKGDPEDRETWRVVKPKWAKMKDPETGKNVDDTTTMIYNKHVTIAGIPEEAEEYQLGPRSALGWIIDRYQVKKDGASGIVNDPNDWADEVGNPRYIVDLVGKVTRVAVETNRIVRGLAK